MTKRKEKPQSKSKPKKRVAFSAPKTAATRAIITRNASTSPLLRLPPELRTRIWTEVLGNELIHLGYHYEGSLIFEDNERTCASLKRSDSLQQSYGSAWRHRVCEDDCPEDSPPRKYVFEWEGGEKVSWLKPHQRCFTEYGTSKRTWPMKLTDCETMELTVLRTCRQIYVEANSILWATNTFSFKDAITFKSFIMTRMIYNKRLIRNIRLEMEWWLDDTKSWNSSLDKTLVKSLSGLRSLRLYIKHDVTREYFECLGTVGFLESPRMCQGLRNLSTLPLTNVEVVVRSSRYGSQEKQWTDNQRKEVAEALRDMLLAPKGAEASSNTQEQGV